MEKSNNKRVLITGVLGQDGSFMAQHLSSLGYDVYGVIRNGTNTKKIDWIVGLVPNIILFEIDILNKNSLFSIINSVHPHEIYNFAGISNVFNAWADLDILFDINARVPQHILEAICEIDKSIRFFQASSCLIFGGNSSGKQDEFTPVNPLYPYGISKLYADNMVKEFRKKFDLYCCSGIFFNHESERRGPDFFSQKIIQGVVDICHGKQQFIKVGNMGAYRDYGYAKDYIKGAHLMLDGSDPKDYIIGTGKLITMLDFTKKCFEYFGLNYENYIVVDPELYRKIDTHSISADATRIKMDLGWTPTTSLENMIEIMIKDYQRKLKLIL